jgi:DNA polymerase
MLQLLDEQILSCTKCELHVNGHAKPYWIEDARYIIVGEAPGLTEIQQCTPFVGKAGEILWNTMKRYCLYREDFLIINSVNCRPVDGNKNGKPTPTQMRLCKSWIDKYLYVLQPTKILLLGKYAVETMWSPVRSIISINSDVAVNKVYGAWMMFSVHPAFCIYNENQGKKLLEESIRKFSELL